ncbi:hypothetical protein AVEN_101625-1 [Araneus ventricosus]|uniref:Uncharacterized protein n=1 Tax=Araneus ventricosus TaxID=182803 RepID=A0A4Y2EYC5_ARAVE|nr:hypothetical protein AVEN_101625-1 [Araneus ventricosus]
MVKRAVPTLEILVAGEPGSGKANFINRFLYYHPSSAEVRRKRDTTHFMYKPGKDFKIQLHDISNVENIDRNSFDKMDVVFFCYAANDPESFQSLEKWIGLMRAEVKEEKMHSSPPRTKKEVHSFLVADLSNSDSQRNVAEHLARKAKTLKEIFGINRFIESSFEDEESASSAFQTIVNELISPKLGEKCSLHKLYKESSEKCSKTYLTEIFPSGLPKPYLDKPSSLGSPNYGDGDFAEIFRYENFEDCHEKVLFRRAAKKIHEMLRDETYFSCL